MAHRGGDATTATSLNELADGLVSVLDAEDISSAPIVGQSPGSMLAETLAQRTPDPVASPAFSGSRLYGTEDVDRIAAKLATIRTVATGGEAGVATPTLS